MKWGITYLRSFLCEIHTFEVEVEREGGGVRSQSHGAVLHNRANTSGLEERERRFIRKEPKKERERKKGERTSSEPNEGKKQMPSFKCIKKGHVLSRLRCNHPSPALQGQAYPFRAVDGELGIDRNIQINYLLGLRFIDKSFGQMISNNHK